VRERKREGEKRERERVHHQKRQGDGETKGEHVPGRERPVLAAATTFWAAERERPFLAAATLPLPLPPDFT